MNIGNTGDFLALINATLNATSAIALVPGFVFIRRKVVDRHRRAMLTAVGASALFLVFYVIRMLLTGTHEFAGEGLARIVYLSILFSHMTLAVLVLPFILRGVSLRGIDSVQTPIARRREVWGRIATDLRPTGLDRIGRDISLDDLDGVLKVFRDYLGAKLRRTSGALTYADVRGSLEEKAVGEELLDRVKRVFETCEASRYAGAAGGKPEAMVRECHELALELEEALK